MQEQVFICRLAQDGRIVEPDCWRVIDETGLDQYIVREPGESNDSLMARAVEAASPGQRLIFHSEVTNEDSPRFTIHIDAE